jgi:hypothetical protein
MIAEINPKLTTKTVLTIIFSCKRVGTDPTGNIEVNSINFNGTYFLNDPNFDNQLKSIFSKLGYDDIDVYNNMLALSNKIYEEGILPLYVERNEKPNDLYEDADFIAYWTSIAQFLSLSYVYAIQFTIIWWRKELLSEYLKQKNVIFCEDADIIELQCIAKTIFNEFRERGTKEIYTTKDYEYPLGYRSRFVLPIGFVIQPTNPIWINGVKYTEAVDLPFGFTIDEDYLYTPDVNYYEVKIVDYLVAPVIDENYIDIVDSLDRVNLALAMPSEPTHFTNVKKPYNGEYLRLICFHNKCDWFAYLLMDKENRGWNIGNSSPLYKGLRNHQNGTFINGYENFAEEVWDLLYYPIIGDTIVPPPPIETFLIKTSDNDLLNANQPDPIQTHVPY